MYKKLARKITNHCIDNPIITICFALFITALAFSGIRHVKQDDNMVNLLPEDIGSRVIFEEIQDDYGLTEYMYVAIGNNNQSIFSKNNFEAIWDLTIEFEELDEVDEVISLSNADKISLDQSDSSIVINNLMEQRTLNDAQIKTITYYLDDNKIIKNRLVSKNEDYANLIIIPQDSDQYVQLARKIHKIAEKYEDEYTLHFGGQAYVTGAVPDMVQDEVVILLLFGILLMSGILFINLKDYKAVFLILIIISISLGSMLGFMGWIYHFTNSSNFYFTMMNTSMPIVLLTIANSDGVHILSRFMKELRKHKNSRVAIIETMENLSLPIFLTSITTSLAFLTLMFSPVSSMIGYGITIALGIMWAWFLSITLLPALISLFKWDYNSKAISQPSFVENLMKKFGYLVTKKPKIVLASGLTIVLFSIIGLSLITVEVQYTKMFRKGNIIRDSAEFLDDHMTGNVNVLLRVTSNDEEKNIKHPDNLKDIELIQTYLDSMENVTSTISIIDVVKQLHKTIMDENHDYYTIPDSMQQVDNLFFLYEMNDDSDISSLINDDENQGILTALMKTFSTLKVSGYVENITNFINEKIANNNLKFELTGMMIFIVDFMWLVIKSSIISILLSIIVIFFVSTIFFRNWKLGALSIIPLFSAVCLNFGFMGWFGIELTHLTALLSAIIIGVGVDFTIHYISEYQSISKKYKLNEISNKTIENVGYPIVLDAWSNMGFGALLLSSIIPLGQIGGLMVFAMISTSLGALTLLASALEIFKTKIK